MVLKQLEETLQKTTFDIMQELFKMLNKKDLFLSRDDRIYSKLYLETELLRLVENQIRGIQELKDKFRIENLQLVLEELEAKGDIFLFKDLVISGEFSQKEMKRLDCLLMENGKISVSSSEIPPEFSGFKNDGKYYYSAQYLEAEFMKLENKLSHATLPMDLTLEIESDLLALLKQEPNIKNRWLKPNTEIGVFKGLTYLPQVYLKNVKNDINTRLCENGIVDITEYLSVIDVKEYSRDSCLIGNNLVSYVYLKAFSEKFLLELKKKGYKRLEEIANMKVTGQLLIKVSENLKEDAIRILDDCFVLKEFIQVLKVELRPIVAQLVEFKRLKKAKDEISIEKALRLMDVVTSKYIQEGELRMEVGELLYTDFLEKVNFEMQKTFKYSRPLESLELRKGLVMLEAFYNGILIIQDPDLRGKLTRVLLDVKVKKFLRNCSQKEENGLHDWDSFKQVLKQELGDMEDNIYNLEIEFEKSKYLEKLRGNLQNETDPALVFHLAISIYFIKFYNEPIYFTGKLVPDVLNLLQIHVDKDSFQFLLNLQNNIIARRKTKVKLDDEILQLKQMLK